jgi:hypothetical protein
MCSSCLRDLLVGWEGRKGTVVAGERRCLPEVPVRYLVSVTDEEE